MKVFLGWVKMNVLLGWVMIQISFYDWSDKQALRGIAKDLQTHDFSSNIPHSL